MNEEQLQSLKNIRNALDDLYGKLDIDLYEKISAAKVSYKLKKPSGLIAENCEYIVKEITKITDEV